MSVKKSVLFNFVKNSILFIYTVVTFTHKEINSLVRYLQYKFYHLANYLRSLVVW